MEPQLDARTREVFRTALTALAEAEVPYLVAGAFALNRYTGIWRYTKDLDLFCPRAVSDRALAVLRGVGFATRIEERHWLGKATVEDVMVDLIWGGGNWATFVEDSWLERGNRGTILDLDVLMISPEDIILSKAYVAGRERFDGTDIAHIIHARGESLDWDGLVERFADHWPLLLHYLVLYRFVYPRDRDRAPTWLVHELAGRIGTDAETRDGLDFRGPLLDRYGYLHDLYGGQPDPRVALARRAGLPVADVHTRRRLDRDAFEAGLPYRQDVEGKGEAPHPFDGLPQVDEAPEG